MKPFILSIVLFYCLGSIAHGRIFESELSLSQRFGPPTMAPRKGKFGSRELSYKSGNWIVHASFIRDQCHAVSYSLIGAANPTQQQLNAVFEANSGGKKWLRKKEPVEITHILLPRYAIYNFVRSDGEVHASKSSSRVTFRSAYWVQAEEELERKRIEKRTSIPNF